MSRLLFFVILFISINISAVAQDSLIQKPLNKADSTYQYKDKSVD